MLFCCQKCLTLSCEVGGKACDAPPVAEKANRVWRSGRLFARIRAEKDENRKRKRDTAHDAVGSSWAGGAIQALQSQCFFVVRNAEHQTAKSVAKPEKRRRWRKKRTGFGAAVGFCGNTRRKDGNRKRKRDTAHDAVGSSGAGGAKQILRRTKIEDRE